MVNVAVVTSNVRGFLKDLFDYPFSEISFSYDGKNLYEFAGMYRRFLASAIQWHIFDYCGIFQIVRPKNEIGDVLFSYNRFIETQKPYIILLENPSALVNYCWERPNYLITKRRLRRLFDNINLHITCMSKICQRTIRSLYEISDDLDVNQIYPLVLDDLSYDIECNKQKCTSNIVECLFISSDFNLKGGCDLIPIFERLRSKNVHLTCITRKNSITKEQLIRIEKLNNFDIIEFNLTRKELQKYYQRSCLLLNPTRMDSFSLVTLEAIKYGCAILGTNMYALKEMVIEDKNGFLINPMYCVWDDNGIIDKYYRDHRRETLISGKIDYNLVEWLINKIEYLINDRAKLLQLCNSSLELARGKDFSEKSIVTKWSNLITKVAKKRVGAKKVVNVF